MSHSYLAPLDRMDTENVKHSASMMHMKPHNNVRVTDHELQHAAVKISDMLCMCGGTFPSQAVYPQSPQDCALPF